MARLPGRRGWTAGSVTVGLAALASAAFLVAFFDSQLVLGLAIDAVLLWLAMRVVSGIVA